VEKESGGLMMRKGLDYLEKGEVPTKGLLTITNHSGEEVNKTVGWEEKARRRFCS
jgi:hypothetical protein